MSEEFVETPEQRQIRRAIMHAIGGRKAGDALVALCWATADCIAVVARDLGHADALCDQMLATMKDTVREDWNKAGDLRSQVAAVTRGGGKTR